MPQINVVVDPEQKDRWESFVQESPQANSLSHLVRLGVERTIADARTDNDRIEDTITSDIGTLLTLARRLETSVDDMETRLTAVELALEQATSSEPMRAPRRDDRGADR